LVFRVINWKLDDMATSPAPAPATVTTLEGRAWIRNSDGTRVELHVGSQIPPGARVETDTGSALQMEVNGSDQVISLAAGYVGAYTGEASGAMQGAGEQTAAQTPQGPDSGRLLENADSNPDRAQSSDPESNFSIMANSAGHGPAGQGLPVVADAMPPPPTLESEMFVLVPALGGTTALGLGLFAAEASSEDTIFLSTVDLPHSVPPQEIIVAPPPPDNGGPSGGFVPEEPITGAEQILGTSGNDILAGGLGNDIIIGGAGDDTLYGGEPAAAENYFPDDDTFVWRLSDQGSAAQRAIDRIMDFGLAEAGSNASGGRDALDLRDLLEGADASQWDNYLSISVGPGGSAGATSVTIDVRPDGANLTQQIVLENVASLAELGISGNNPDQTAVIQQLINDKLIIV
jgi:hypothetical protein